MKKVFLFSIMCLMAIAMNAQRCAVVGFKAGAKVSLSDIDGISETFSTYFRPQGYTMVDRLYIDKALAEQRIQRSSITEDLAVSAGKYMNVSKVVVGKVYISFDGGYQVDVTVLDVQSGLHVANDGTTVTPGNYRQSIQTLAKRLAGKIAIKPGQTVAPTKPSANNNTTTTQQRTTPYILYDYLKVFPNDLGTFDAEPKTVIAQLNKAQKYGYGTWRLPTNEEMALMRAENVVGLGTYMTKENPKGTVRLVTDREKGELLTETTVSKSSFTETAFGINMRMVWVEGGEFVMGCTSEQGSDCYSDEKNVRRVTVDGFYIGMLEVTQSQWEKVMNTTIDQQKNKTSASNTYGVGPDYPMYYVSWEEAMEFCRLLSQQTGKTYTLPTEAQWEYAARGGAKNEGTKYSGSHYLDNVAWYNGNSGNSTHVCGTKRANALGIYDMSGNVWEWCKDWYGDSYISYDVNNPQGASSGSDRVLRGGSWRNYARYCRVAFRFDFTPGGRDFNYGFRVVLIP